MAQLFISQDRIDAWTAEKRITLEGQTMTLADDGRSFNIRPAVRFLKVSGGGDDPNDLLDTVKDAAALEELGAEHYLESVILGDTAYDVQQGFLGDPLPRGG